MDENVDPPDKIAPEPVVVREALLPSQDWLAARFPLLHEQEFYKELIRRFETEGKLNPTGTDELLLQVSPSDPIYSAMQTAVESELARLTELSLLEELNGDPLAARSAFVYMLATGGVPVIPDGRATAVNAAIKAMRLWSSEAFLYREVFDYLSWLLGYGGDLSPSVRAELMDALERILQEGAAPAEETSDCLKKGLQLETKLFDGAPERKQMIMRWITFCVRYGDANLCILLDVVHDLSSDIDIKQNAKAAAYDLRGSIRRIWHETIVDQVSSLGARAERLSMAKSMQLGEADMAQYIISQCKGEAITAETDPRLPYLLDIMREGSERIRLAAARCLTECFMLTQPLAETRESLYCVSEILVNAGDSRYIGDALWILNTFKVNNPASAAFADAAISTATSKFLR